MITLNTDKLEKNTLNDILTLMEPFKRDWVRYADFNRLCKLVLSEFKDSGEDGPSQIKAALQYLHSEGRVQYKKVGIDILYESLYKECIS